MTEVSEFEHEVRVALLEAHAAAPEPSGLADRLIAAATFEAPASNRAVARRWLPPLLAAAAIAAVALTSVVVVSFTLSDGSPPASGDVRLSTPLIAPKSLRDVDELAFHVNSVPGILPHSDWELGRDFQGTAVTWNDQELSVRVYYQYEPPQYLSPESLHEEVSVNGVTGVYVEHHNSDGKYGQALLEWQYAADSWAEVASMDDTAPRPGPATRAAFLTIAEAVRAGGPALRLPFRAGAVPPSLPRLASASDIEVRGPGDPDGWTAIVSFDNGTRLEVSAIGDYCEPGSYGYATLERFEFRGFTGCLRGRANAAAPEAVVLQAGGIDRVIIDSGIPVEDSKQVLADLATAPVGAPALGTWFDLRTALTG